MIPPPRWSGTTFFLAGSIVWGLVLVGCVTVNRAVLAPPKVAGATFVGTKECVQCHSEITDHFDTATHSRLALADAKVGSTGCEACHGPGSLHAKAGGGKGNIVNPSASPETCFQCHLDKRGEFNLPNAHPVLAGQVTCNDCHDPHKGHVISRTGADLATPNETCTKCHVAQKGPFLFKHEAMEEGCTACHNPHGSVNQKMLVARDANLCLRCHLEHPAVEGNGTIMAGGADHRTRLQNGTCWSAGCHEEVHGSNASKAMRY